MDKIKIIVISTSGFGERNGIAAVLYEYFKRFDKSIFEIHLVINCDSNEEVVNRFSSIGVKPIVLSDRNRDVLRYMSDLYKQIKQNKYNAIYVHGSSSLMIIELLVACLGNCKVRVVHSHNTTCNYKNMHIILKPLFKFLYTDAIGCGEEAGQWLFGNKPFKVIKNARSIPEYKFDSGKRKQIRDDFKIDDRTLVIGHVGNFTKQKNQEFAVKVFSEILKRRNDCKMFFMGSGSQMLFVKNKAKELGVFDNIIFTGSIPNVSEMLQAMDVMILPSLHEGLPLVVIEWQIAALPSIISDTVTKECRYSNLVSFLPLDNAEAWAEKVLEVSVGDRVLIAEEQIELTKAAGYDIDRNAIKLQEFFVDKCRMREDTHLRGAKH